MSEKGLNHSGCSVHTLQLLGTRCALVFKVFSACLHVHCTGISKVFCSHSDPLMVSVLSAHLHLLSFSGFTASSPSLFGNIFICLFDFLFHQRLRDSRRWSFRSRQHAESWCFLCLCSIEHSSYFNPHFGSLLAPEDSSTLCPSTALLTAPSPHEHKRESKHTVAATAQVYGTFMN